MAEFALVLSGERIAAEHHQAVATIAATAGKVASNRWLAPDRALEIIVELDPATTAQITLASQARAALGNAAIDANVVPQRRTSP